MRLLLVFTFLLTAICPVRSQSPDSLQHNIDSFSRAIDSFNKDMSSRLQAQQDSFMKQELQRSMEQNGRNLDNYLAGMREREEKEDRQMYIRLGLGVAFLVVMIIALIRRRKRAQ